MSFTALLLAGVLMSAQADTVPAVQGRVVADPGGEPLRGALVEMVTVAGRRLAVTDSAGSYRFPIAGERGEARLRASRLGYRALEVDVWLPGRGDLVVDLALAIRPLPVPGVVARVPSTREGDARQDGAPLPSPVVSRILESGSGLAGLAAVRPDDPSGQPPTDPADVLYVRGSPADLKLVLLDGAPVYSPFHLAGLLDAFEPEAIGEGRLYVGGAPARYDGGLSYVLSLSTREPAGGFRASASADMLGARGVLETGTAERLRVLAAGRGLHALGPTALLGGPFPYGYADGLVRVDADLGTAGRISTTGFLNRERVRPGDPGEPGPEWGNDAMSVRHRIGLAGAEVETGLSAGRFSAVIPPVGERGGERGENRRVRATLDAVRPVESVGSLVVRAGGAFDRIDLEHDVSADQATYGSHVAGETAGGYLDVSWSPWERLQLRGGLRGDLFLTAAEARLAPRLSATWRVAERAELFGALGRYHQYVREVVPRQADGQPTLLTPEEARLEVGGATHVTVGLHQEMDADVRLGVEGYFKRFDAAAARLVEANASGVDLWVRRDAGAVRGWLGYSLVWNWTAGVDQTAVFVGRQIMNAGVRAAPGGWAELEARLSYGAGLPFTGIHLVAPAQPDSHSPGREREVRGLAAAASEEPVVGPPSDPFLRLDLFVSREISTEMGGRTHHLTPYLRIINALDRRDASFYLADASSPQARPIATLPILPIAGVSWRF